MLGIFPHPAMSISILLLWVALNNSASIGTLVLGGVLALGLPLAIHRFWTDAPQLAHPGLALITALRIAADILLANWAVARLVVGPIRRLNPAFIEVPLDIRDPFVATVLAGIVTLTPGTVSVDVDQESWILKVHALDAPDPAALVRDIKQRYETPLRKIFTC